MDNDTTRDMAIQTAAQVQAHVADCFQVRIRNEAKLDKIDEKIDQVDEKIDENTSRIYAKLDKLQMIVLPILGGLILAAHSIDWILQFLGHKP